MKWGRTKKIAKKVLGEKYRVDLVPIKSLKKEVQEAVLRDAVKIF